MNKVADFFYIPKGIPEPKLFRKMIRISIAIHLAAFLFLGLRAAIFPTEPLDLDSAIHVDMVGLPDKAPTLPEKPPEVQKENPPEKAAPKVTMTEPAKSAPVVLKPKKADLSKAIDQIRKQQESENRKKAVEELAQEMKAQQQKEQRQEQVAKLLKGNMVSPGSALHGLNKSDFNEYIGQIQTHIQQHWDLPGFLQNDTLNATVIVFLDYRGVVINKKLEKTSGNPLFDDYALKAVEKSSPFPTPPPKFVDLVRVNGIVLRFPQ